MTQHTPGPWTCEKTEHGLRVAGPLHVRVAYCSTSASIGSDGSYRIGTREAEDNARLIAAAPDLLDALRALYEATPDNQGGTLGEACRKARAALAKATGGLHD